MNESKNTTTRFTLEAFRRTAAQTKALRQRLEHADEHATDRSNTPELSDEWFLCAAHEGQPATAPAKNHRHQTR